jgi:hypothetical protein
MHTIENIIQSTYIVHECATFGFFGNFGRSNVQMYCLWIICLTYVILNAVGHNGDCIASYFLIQNKYLSLYTVFLFSLYFISLNKKYNSTIQILDVIHLQLKMVKDANYIQQMGKNISIVLQVLLHAH